MRNIYYYLFSAWLIVRFVMAEALEDCPELITLLDENAMCYLHLYGIRIAERRKRLPFRWGVV